MKNKRMTNKRKKIKFENKKLNATSNIKFLFSLGSKRNSRKYI